MKTSRLTSILALVLVVLLTFTSCSPGPAGVAGAYTMVKGPAVGVTVTFGKNGTFGFSSGATGTYEVNGDTVLLVSESFGGRSLKKDGDTLSGTLNGSEWRLVRQK